MLSILLQRPRSHVGILPLSQPDPSTDNGVPSGKVGQDPCFEKSAPAKSSAYH